MSLVHLLVRNPKDDKTPIADVSSMSKLVKKQHDKKFLSSAGFTLIELLVVIIIIGILVSFISLKAFDGITRARDAQRKSNLKQLQAALQIFFQDNGTYPNVNKTCKSTENCWASLVGQGQTIYIKSVPTDPINNADHLYYYCLLDPNTYVLVANLENAQDPEITTDTKSCTASGSNWYVKTNP